MPQRCRGQVNLATGIVAWKSISHDHCVLRRTWTSFYTLLQNTCHFCSSPLEGAPAYVVGAPLATQALELARHSIHKARLQLKTRVAVSDSDVFLTYVLSHSKHWLVRHASFGRHIVFWNPGRYQLSLERNFWRIISIHGHKYAYILSL